MKITEQIWRLPVLELTNTASAGGGDSKHCDPRCASKGDL